jgi:hypothetical protein
MSDRRCLLVSTCNADLQPWNGVCWEFLDVISAIEDAVTVAPPGRFHFRHPLPKLQEVAAELALRADLRLRGLVGRHGHRLNRARLHADYDLTFFVCQFAEEIHEIEQVKGWRERSGFAAIFILESWSSTFAANRHRLRLLDRFDHVFVLNGSCIEALRRYTSTPVSQLSSASDCLLATPVPNHPARYIDFTCIGRRRREVHEILLAYARDQGLFYHHDVWRNLLLADTWASVRGFNANIVKRSRYYLVWDPKTANPDKHHIIGGDDPLSTRYFEGIAGGAVLLGTAPACPEFAASFDWPDAVVGLGDDPVAVIRDLDADPGRTTRIRQANMTNALLRHDWAHRWRQVLEVAGAKPTARHEGREQQLASRASEVASSPALAAGDLGLVRSA